MKNEPRSGLHFRIRLPRISRISNGLAVLGLALALSACMSIPASVIDGDAWLGGMPTQHEGLRYRGAWQGRWAAPIYARPDEIQRLVLIDIKNDPVYQAFELQRFETAEGPRAVFIAARKSGAHDYYYQAGISLSAERQAGVAALINQPAFIQKEFDFELEVGTAGLRAYVAIEDTEGRPIRLSIEENEPARRLSGILAPVSSNTRHPISFPLVYLDQFSMVLVANTSIDIEIGGHKRQPVVFPLLVDGRRVYYSRYASKVAIADILPEAVLALPLQETLSDGQELFVSGAASYELVWNQGHPELVASSFRSGDSLIRLEFRPALPDFASIEPGQRLSGRFLLGVNEHRAVIAGVYHLDSPDDSSLVFELRPRHGWQPPGMSRQPWVSTFHYKALIQTQADFLAVTADWQRVYGRGE